MIEIQHMTCSINPRLKPIFQSENCYLFIFVNVSQRLKVQEEMGDKIDKILKGMEGGRSADGRTIRREEEKGSGFETGTWRFRFEPN